MEAVQDLMHVYRCYSIEERLTVVVNKVALHSGDESRHVHHLSIVTLLRSFAAVHVVSKEAVAHVLTANGSTLVTCYLYHQAVVVLS